MFQRGINTRTSERFRLTQVAGGHVVADSLTRVAPPLATAALERELIAAGVIRKKRAAVIDQQAAAFVPQGTRDRPHKSLKKEGRPRKGRPLYAGKSSA